MSYLARRHLFYYGSLAIVLLGLLAGIILTPGDNKLHMSIVTLMAVFYVLWAIIHHLMHHDIHTKIVIEYVLIGMVGITFVYFVLTSIS